MADLYQPIHGSLADIRRERAERIRMSKAKESESPYEALTAGFAATSRHEHESIRAQIVSIREDRS